MAGVYSKSPSQNHPETMFKLWSTCNRIWEVSLVKFIKVCEAVAVVPSTTPTCFRAEWANISRPRQFHRAEINKLYLNRYIIIF